MSIACFLLDFHLDAMDGIRWVDSELVIHTRLEASEILESWVKGAPVLYDDLHHYWLCICVFDKGGKSKRVLRISTELIKKYGGKIGR